jgi:hypothetical protein
MAWHARCTAVKSTTVKVNQEEQKTHFAGLLLRAAIDTCSETKHRNVAPNKIPLCVSERDEEESKLALLVQSRGKEEEGKDGKEGERANRRCCPRRRARHVCAKSRRKERRQRKRERTNTQREESWTTRTEDERKEERGGK